MLKFDELRDEVQGLLKKIEDLEDADKRAILAALRGMLLVADAKQVS